MTTNYAGLIKKWMYASLSLLLLLALLISIFVLKSSTEPKLIFASEDGEADANERSADANSEPEQERKAKEDRKVLRPDHNHPAFGERTAERAMMVTRQIDYRGVRDPNVLAAMGTVPRHAFVRPRDLRQAYADYAISIGLNQSISQPYIVAYMTEVLKLRPDSKVFEVGTGSGYQAAVCAEIAREVYTVEIIEKLAESAKERLKKLGYRNVTVKASDGYFGWKEKGPFDAIIITAAAGLVPPPLIEQLKPGGQMILPLGSPYGAQTLVLITKDDKGEVRSKRLLPVRFVPMTGHIIQTDRPPGK